MPKGFDFNWNHFKVDISIFNVEQQWVKRAGHACPKGQVGRKTDQPTQSRGEPNITTPTTSRLEMMAPEWPLDSGGKQKIKGTPTTQGRESSVNCINYNECSRWN